MDRWVSHHQVGHVWLAHAMGRLWSILWAFGPMSSISALQLYYEYYLLMVGKGGGNTNYDFSTSCIFYSHLICNNWKWMKPFLLFHLWPSALKYIKQIEKNQIIFNSFVAAKLTYTKIFVSRFLVEFLVLRVWVFVWKLAL